MRVPGDKSISHRALILGALTVGETRITGLLEGEDVINTAKAMRALGAKVERTGRGRLARARAWASAASRSPRRRSISAIPAPAAGWSSARSRAARSRRPSTAMPRCARGRCGACSIRWSGWARDASSSADGGRLPLTLQGARDPIPIVYAPPVASAQVKSAVLLAGLAAPGETTVIESEATRDHTERMLRHFGAEVRGRARRRAWPPHHAERPARARAGARRGAGRSFLRVPLLNELIERFPRNFLFRLETVQMYSDLGQKEPALAELNKTEQLKRSNTSGFEALPMEKIQYYRGNLLFWYMDLDRALEEMKKATSGAQRLDLHTALLAWMRLGQLYDMKGRRNEAVSAYKQAIAVAPESDVAKESKQYVSSPYKRA